MARPKSSTNITLANQMASISQAIQTRYAELKGELDQLSDQYQRITGKHLTPGKVNGLHKAVESAAPVSAIPAGKATGKTKGGKKRRRMPSPSIEWLQETLGKKGMTVKQLQEAADEANLSGLSIAALLNENKSKFKAEAGKKQEGKKGIPAMVWGVK